MYHFIQNAISPPPDIQNAFRFFSWVRVCMLYTHKLDFFSRRMYTVHTGIFFVHLVFFTCVRLRFVFLTMCTDHRSTTRHLILDLFFLEVPEDVL